MSTVKDLLTHPGDRTIGWALTQAARLHRTHLNMKLAELGLFAGQEQVLDTVNGYGALTISELAAMLRVRAPTASKMVTRLTALGFVQRDPGRKDARTVRVRLTRKGRMVVTRLQGLWDEVERDLLKDLSSTEQRQLQELLLRVAMNFSTVVKNHEQAFRSVSATWDDQQAHEHQSPSKTGVLPIPDRAV
jgi:DNA-binding MarR family transcriptional regulator